MKWGEPNSDEGAPPHANFGDQFPRNEVQVPQIDLPIPGSGWHPTWRPGGIAPPIDIPRKAINAISAERQIPTLLSGVKAEENQKVTFAADSEEAKVYERTKDATVRIEVRRRGADGEQTGASGSGFFIQEDGKIATAYHVIAMKPEKIVVQTADGRTFNAKISDVKPGSDMATLDLEGAGNTRFPFLNLAETSTTLKNNDHVYVVGHPKGWADTYLSPGVVSGRSPVSGLLVEHIDGQNPQRMLLRATSHTEPGNSGGPVVDKDGRVVGLVSYGDVPTVDAGTVEDLHSLLGNAKFRDYLPHDTTFDWRTASGGMLTLGGATAAYGLARTAGTPSRILGASTRLVGVIGAVNGVTDLLLDDLGAFRQSWSPTGSTAERFSTTTNIAGDLSQIAGGLGISWLGPKYKVASSILLTAGTGVKFLNHLFSDRAY